jgi:hypothetical protein
VRRAIAALVLVVAASASGQEVISAEAARLDMTLGKVRPKARIYFYSDSDKARCPAPIESCRRKAYLMPGDVVLLGEIRDPMVFAAFANGKTMTEGWLPRTAVVPMPAPPSKAIAWHGAWVRDDEADIDIKSGAQAGTLHLEGQASWGSHDPDRVERGGVHVGDFDEIATPDGDRIRLGSGQPDECHVSLRLIGPYLVAADNNMCGGMNVSFSGVYRRAPTH